MNIGTIVYADVSLSTDSNAHTGLQSLFDASDNDSYTQLSDSPEIDYTHQMDELVSVGVFAIFALGVICGLLMTNVLLRRVFL